MPIHGLTNSTTKAFMKLGQIRKGDRGGKNNAPRDLDHFRVTAMQGKNAEELMKTFEAKYGKEPVEINVRFAYNTVAEVWDAKYECYRQGGLVAQAGSNEHGAYWIFYRDPQTSEVLVRDGSAVGFEGRKFLDDTPCDPSVPVYHTADKKPVYLEPTGRLQVVIPELAHLAVGFFEFRPTSPRDIRNISNELGGYEATARQYGGSLSGIPFKLIRRKEEVTKKIGDKLTKGDSWVVHIVAGGDWGMKAIEAIERLALSAGNDEIVDVEEATWVEETAPAIEANITPPLQMTYDDAKQVIVKTKSGTEKFMTELSKDQLVRVKNSPNTSDEQKLAAETILAVDHGVNQ